MSLEYLQAWIVNNLCKKPIPVLDHPRDKEIYPYIQSEPSLAQLCVILQCLISGYQGDVELRTTCNIQADAKPVLKHSGRIASFDCLAMLCSMDPKIRFFLLAATACCWLTLMLLSPALPGLFLLKCPSTTCLSAFVSVQYYCILGAAPIIFLF